MIKKTLKFRNMFDNEVERDLYFGLTKAEYLELEAFYQNDGGVVGRMEVVQRGDDYMAIVETFKEIIGRSYGERQGERFVKTPDIKAAFLASDAYSEILFGLIQGDDDPGAFIKGILPSNVGGQNGNPDMTPSERARAASEARMQGFKQKQQPKQGFEPTPELDTAEPQLEEKVGGSDNMLVDGVKDGPEQKDAPSYEDFLAWKATQN